MDFSGIGSMVALGGGAPMKYLSKLYCTMIDLFKSRPIGAPVSV